MADEVGKSTVFFPVVGFLLGSVLVLLDFMLAPLAAPVLVSVILAAILALMTRGLHLDGLADTVDGLGGGADRERALRIMDDSRIGAFGVIAIVLVLFVKIHAIESLEVERWRALLAAPVLGRWAMVLLGHGSTPAKPGLGSMLIDHLSARCFFTATFITLIFVAAVLHSIGIAVMAWVAAFTLASKAYLHRRLGGVTGDTFGAVGELSETSVLFFLALALR